MIRKRFGFDRGFKHRHKDDVLRIQQVLFDNGFEADLESCATLWEKYSDSLAAGWIFLSEYDDELFNLIHPYIIVDD